MCNDLDGKTTSTIWKRILAPRVRDVITYSKEEALRLGHDYIGTEHLLLGIIREGEGTAIQILKDLGLNLKQVRSKIEGLSTPYATNNPANGAKFTFDTPGRKGP